MFAHTCRKQQKNLHITTFLATAVSRCSKVTASIQTHQTIHVYVLNPVCPFIFTVHNTFRANKYSKAIRLKSFSSLCVEHPPLWHPLASFLYPKIQPLWHFCHLSLSHSYLCISHVMRCCQEKAISWTCLTLYPENPIFFSRAKAIPATFIGWRSNWRKTSMTYESSCPLLSPV